MRNFAENLNLGNRFQPPPPGIPGRIGHNIFEVLSYMAIQMNKSYFLTTSPEAVRRVFWIKKLLYM